MLTMATSSSWATAARASAASTAICMPPASMAALRAALWLLLPAAPADATPVHQLQSALLLASDRAKHDSAVGTVKLNDGTST